MSRPPAPLFLARRRYRRRRLRDAARLLPVAGAVALALPLFRAPEARGTGWALLYVFGVWTAMILAAAALSRVLAQETRADDPDEGP